MPTDGKKTRIDVVAALQVLVELRKPDQIVVTNQGSARVWPQLGKNPLDFHYNPSTMGGAIPLALGLTLAQPSRDVLAVSGDGALLMSLGSLVTVMAAGLTNLTVVVLNNGLYEVTGGQKTPATDVAVDYCGLARAAGFSAVAEFQDLSDWQLRAAATLALPGPRFISLIVRPTPSEYLRLPTPPLAEQIERLRSVLR
jgi:sulfopyruvate decarboxylase subunit beta